MKKNLFITTALGLLLAGSNAMAKSDCATGEENCWSCSTSKTALCTARLDANGAMTITGNTSMSTAPWGDKMSNITSVTIGEGITNVGSSAFKGASNLTNISLSSSVTSIGSSAFSGTTSLTNVNFLGNSKLETIGASVFNGSGISSIDIPNSVTSIGKNAFSSSGLTQLDIPASVSSIGDSAFSSTKNLTNVHIAEDSQLTTIGGSVFKGSGLTAINIPESVTSIGSGAFSGTSQLEVVNFSDNSKLETIGDSAFSGSSLTTGFNLPNSVTSIGNYAFYTADLTEFNISSGSRLENIGNQAFWWSSIQDVNLPDGLKTIGYAAFRNTQLSGDIYIPDSVTKVGGEAFFQLGKVTGVVFSENSQLESLGSGTFLTGTVVTTLILPPNLQFDPDTTMDFSGAGKLKTIYLTLEQAANLTITGKENSKTFSTAVYQISEDGIMVSQNGREMNKYGSFDAMIKGDWTERYEYSDDRKYGGLRQEAFAKDGDGEKYIGAKIFRPDGSIVLVDENNKFINKLHAKIYTVEEAMAVTRDGNVNRVRLTYK